MTPRPDPHPFDWAVGEAIQDISTALARRLLKLARAVARGKTDANVIEEARRITWEMRARATKRAEPARARAAAAKLRAADGRFAAAALRELAVSRRAA